MQSESKSAVHAAPERLAAPPAVAPPQPYAETEAIMQMLDVIAQGLDSIASISPANSRLAMIAADLRRRITAVRARAAG